MIESYRAWIEAGASTDQASKATKELEVLRDNVNAIEVKINILIALTLLILGSIGGLYYQLINLARVRSF